jgi:hypothetical protein
MMKIFRSEFEFQIDARSVEGRFRSKRYSSSETAVAVAKQLGMTFSVDPLWVLDHGSRMPGAAQGCEDDQCQVTDAALAALGFELVASWVPGPTSRIA